MMFRVLLPDRDVTLREQVNPRWWAQVADSPEPPDHYEPTAPDRSTRWRARNWLHNFRRYVVGVSHLPRVCVGSMTTTGNAFRQPWGMLTGWTFAPWRPPLPYLSVRLRRPAAVYDLALGWSVFGMLMVKARIMRPGAFDWE